METEYDDWEPPSEATMKLLQARRERSDKISKLMGDYLLKGYKMLGTTCPQCDTILLQTKQGSKYCVACSELDSDADKDDPVTNQAAALAQAREREVRESTSRPRIPPTPVLPPAPAPTPQTPASTPQISAPTTQPPTPVTQPEGPHFGQGSVQSGERPMEIPVANMTPGFAVLGYAPQAPPLACVQGVNMTANASSFARTGSAGGESERCVKDLLDKMDWAAGELRGTPSVEYSIQLCQLIKSCAEAVSSVRAALNSHN